MPISFTTIDFIWPLTRQVKRSSLIEAYLFTKRPEQQYTHIKPHTVHTHTHNDAHGSETVIHQPWLLCLSASSNNLGLDTQGCNLTVIQRCYTRSVHGRLHTRLSGDRLYLKTHRYAQRVCTCVSSRCGQPKGILNCVQINDKRKCV